MDIKRKYMADKPTTHGCCSVLHCEGFEEVQIRLECKDPVWVFDHAIAKTGGLNQINFREN